jgi:hypothetical protein
VVALGLRVLVKNSEATIQLKGHHYKEREEKEVQLALGTTMADYESNDNGLIQREDDDQGSDHATAGDTTGGAITENASDQDYKWEWFSNAGLVARLTHTPVTLRDHFGSN